MECLSVSFSFDEPLYVGPVSNDDDNRKSCGRLKEQIPHPKQ
jgi:hypothetical protein